MLTYEQLIHFAEHGWVLLEEVFTPEQCKAYIAALDRAHKLRVCGEGTGGELVTIDNIVFYDDVFIDWLTIPAILEANAQVLGAKLKFQGVNAHIKFPHPDRHAKGKELLDPETFGWHRGMRPKWGIFPDDNDPRLINAAFLNNITYLTDVSPNNGSAALLDGSHKYEGDYASLKEKCPIVYPSVKSGGVLLFTESLIHSAVPILSENVRYNMYYGFVPPWFRCWPGMEMPQELVETLRNKELRELFASHNYGGQWPQTPSIPKN